MNLKKGIYRFLVYIKKSLGVFPVAKIVSPNECGTKVAVLVNESNEDLQVVPVYNFINKGTISIHVHEISLYKYKNATLFYDSDLLLVGKDRMVWPKYFNYNYCKNLVRDDVYIEEKNGQIYYKNYKVIKRYDVVFSMLGKFSQVWAHAIVEYLPKLAVLRDAIRDCKNKITVLVPEYKDPQLKEIIYNELNKYNVDIEVVYPKQAISSEIAYYIERPAFFTDHEVNVSIGDQYIPYKTVDVIRKLLVDTYAKNSIIQDKYRYIFLPRRGGLGKGIINEPEIEQFFKNKGFYFVEPHKLTLKDKIDLFQSAEIIVGPAGSAFTNLIFCRPGTKVLCFSNYQRLFDNYISMPLQHFGVRILYLSGFDNKKENPAHCSYSLNLNDVITAAKTIGVFDE